MTNGLFARQTYLSGRRGLTLVEMVISIAIVGVMLVAALNTVGAAKLGAQTTGDHAKGTLLAQQLMAEILRQSYEEQVDTVAFGREMSESSMSRANFDDVDDYDGWSASPPQYLDGSVIPDLAGWGRQVSVTWGDPSNLKQAAVVETDVKLITVTVTHDDRVVGSLNAIRTAARDNLED